MRRQTVRYPYRDTAEERILDLAPDGIPCIPVLEKLDYRKVMKGSAPHVHPGCMEITFCRGGELTFECEGVDYPFRPGEVFVTLPTERHRLKTTPRGLRVYGIYFRRPGRGETFLGLPATERRWLLDRIAGMPLRLFVGGDHVRRAFRELFRIYDTLPPRTAQRRLRMRHAVLELLLAVADAAYAQNRSGGGVSVEQVVSEIRANPVHDVSVDEIARRLNLSREALRRLFLKTTGMPPHAFTIACRIAKARELLEEEDLAVSIIADRLGFSSPQNFATQFRLSTGLTPSAWRQGARGARGV